MWPNRHRRFLAVMVLVALSGCGSLTRWGRRETAGTDDFAPAAVQLQPSFTRTCAPDPARQLPARIETYIVLKDQFGDPIKALGTLRFEIFEHQATGSDPRGKRLETNGVQEIDLTELSENQKHWDTVTRCYRINVALPDHALADRPFALQVTFLGRDADYRLEDTLVIRPEK